MGVGTVAAFSCILATFPLWVLSQIRQGHLDNVILFIIGNHRQNFLHANRVVIGGVIAIILVNLVVAAFLLVAFVFEKTPSTPDRKKKE